VNICLFDIDGTLLASGGAGRAAMEAALAEAFGLTRLSGKVPFSGRTDRAIGRDLLYSHGIEPSAVNWERLRATYLRLLPDCLRRHQGRVLPGMLWLLDHLQQRRGWALGLLTGNLRAGALLKLGHYALDHHFAFGGFGDEHLDRDDVAREALAAACTHVCTTVEPHRVWVIGDTPLDVRCARCIGARVVAVATGTHSLEELVAHAPDLALADLADPTPLLDHWG
jgi:phosphoglycolate phosphatase-like HAD superfamily hydrolase